MRFVSLTRTAVLRDTAQGSGTSMFAAVQTAAPSLRVEINPVNMRDAGEIERAVAAFAHASNGGLIVTPSGPADSHPTASFAARSPPTCPCRRQPSTSWSSISKRRKCLVLKYRLRCCARRRGDRVDQSQRAWPYGRCLHQLRKDRQAPGLEACSRQPRPARQWASYGLTPASARSPTEKP
jgi:hypothetical protein